MPKPQKADRPVQIRMSKSLIDRVKTQAEKERRSLIAQMDMVVEAGLKSLYGRSPK